MSRVAERDGEMHMDRVAGVKALTTGTGTGRGAALVFGNIKKGRKKALTAH